jgi:hypothetical protein
MNRKQHLAQAEITLAGLRKLAMPDDYLAIVDGAMVAGYHLGNALLHARGVSSDAEHANTPSKLERAIDALPVEIRSAFAAFEELEKFRFDFVRNASVYEPRLNAAVWRCLKAMHDACTSI